MRRQRLIKNPTTTPFLSLSFPLQLTIVASCSLAQGPERMRAAMAVHSSPAAAAAWMPGWCGKKRKGGMMSVSARVPCLPLPPPAVFCARAQLQCAPPTRERDGDEWGWGRRSSKAERVVSLSPGVAFRPLPVSPSSFILTLRRRAGRQQSRNHDGGEGAHGCGKRG